MSDIFISYEKSDLRHVAMLARALKRRGWTAFWDRTIPAGSTWRKTIGAELDGARCVVVLWSRTSIASDWVHEEAEEARRRRVLVPVLIENVTPPIGFRSIQANDLSNWDGAESVPSFRKLIADITGLIGPGRNPKSGWKIYLSRAQSDAHLAKAFAEKLIRKLEGDAYFVDADVVREAIAQGEEIEERLYFEAASANVLLAFFAFSWAELRKPAAFRNRPDDGHEVIRTEIRAALERNVLIVPIVDGPYPHPEMLPPDLAGLADWNGFAQSLRSTDDLSVVRLAQLLKQKLAPA